MAYKTSKKQSASSVGDCIAEAARIFNEAAADRALHEVLRKVAAISVRALKKGGKILICGNGGSAGEATHLAGELVGPFFDRSRPAYAAVPLGCDPCTLTAVANDIGYETIFSRQIQGIGKKGDVLWAMSTTGNSPNVIAALKQARSQGLISVLLTNHSGGKGAALADHLLYTPKASTPRVQELHLLYGHWLCEEIEDQMMTFENSNHGKKKKKN